MAAAGTVFLRVCTFHNLSLNFRGLLELQEAQYGRLELQNLKSHSYSVETLMIQVNSIGARKISTA
jgi:hypothetical protein